MVENSLVCAPAQLNPINAEAIANTQLFLANRDPTFINTINNTTIAIIPPSLLGILLNNA